jgi:hypothetical protein
MVTLNIKVTTEIIGTTERNETEFYCPNKVEAYKLALYLSDAGYKDIRIMEGV